jgi:hypothetical protein
MAENEMTRCAHPDCTCHTQDGDTYCSDACRIAGETGGSGCRCGHAACAATEYSTSRRTATKQASATRGAH